MRVLTLVLLCLFRLSICNGYRLLGIFPYYGKSHFIISEHLMKGLARKGHQIDVISTFPLKKPYPNYTDIMRLETPGQLVNNISYEYMKIQLSDSSVTHFIATIAGNDLCQSLGNTDILKLIRDPPKNPPYDAVIIEVFGAQCLAIIGHLWKVPIIGISTTPLYSWMHGIIDFPENLAFVPNNYFRFIGRMNFWQRLYNILQSQYHKLYFYYYTRKQDDIIREHFGPGMPSVRELERKISLILINSHISLNGIKPTIPAAVDVGGIHIQDENLIVQPELEKWMNDSKDGFVYLTFGSMVLIETFPRKVLDIFYTSLGKIAPVRVLMKVPYPKKLPTGLPGNVYTFPWMPQIKILQHPNIKAFITHGGLLGTQEAVAYGVPMIGMPLFADQFTNIDVHVSRNVALKLDIKSITEKDLDAALDAILWNPVYRESARSLSRRFLDRPLSNIDTANYWVEYVIKYGSDALRSPSMDLTWWQLNLIDVVGFLLLCAVIIIAIIVLIIRFLFKVINGYNNSSFLQHSKKTN